MLRNTSIEELKYLLDLEDDLEDFYYVQQEAYLALKNENMIF